MYTCGSLPATPLVSSCDIYCLRRLPVSFEFPDATSVTDVEEAEPFGTFYIFLIL